MLPPTAPLPARIAEADKLPSPPAVAVEVARLSRLDTTVVDDLGAVIARDPALAARLLRVVNSAANGLSGSIDSIPRACSMLGLHQTRDLALGFAISDNLPVVDASSGFDLEQYWTRSSMTAAAARSVALRVRPGYADTAFVLGLLSELGRLVMAAVIPDDYRPLLLENRWPTPTQERARFGYSNLEISAGLMSHWKLPEELILPIAYRDRPQELGSEAPVEVAAGCRIVSTARLISDVWYVGADSRAMQWAAGGAESYLGLDPGRFQDILEDLQAEVDGGGHGSFAHIQPPDIIDMAKIQREAAEKLGRVVAQGRKTSLLLNLLKQQPQD